MDRHAQKEDFPAAVKAWTWFLKCCFLERVAPDRFAALVDVHFDVHRYPLPEVVVADILLGPIDDRDYRIDQKVPFYLQQLLKQQYVDIPAVLRALFKYSTIHSRVADLAAGNGPDKESQNDQDGGDGHQKKKKEIRRWKGSYRDEELIISRLAKKVKEGSAFKTCRSVIQVSRVLAAWMPLLAEAAADFSRDPFGTLSGMQGRKTYRTLQGLQVMDETERSRKALILFLAAFSDDPWVRLTLAQPFCKGTCKMLADALRRFMPWVMQVSYDLAMRLDQFRTETLYTHLPAEKKEADEATSYMDGLVNLDNVQIPEVPVVNSRAGLYIYLSAALVGRPMIDDSALFIYLHNRYQVSFQRMNQCLAIITNHSPRAICNPPRYSSSWHPSTSSQTPCSATRAPRPATCSSPTW
jgi:mediator of RNA polymerase II transcription subunit 5